MAHEDSVKEFPYKNTEWFDMPGDIIGFGGRKGGAFDEMFLIFNTCGPETILSQMSANLDAIHEASR